MYRSGQKSGPIQTISDNIRPLAKTVQCTVFHQNISKIAIVA